MMWLIVGLGNPGPKYGLTRHNVGFLALDSFLQSLVAGTPSGVAPSWQEEMKALTVKLKIDDQSVVLVKPQTFMNKSGESVVPLLHYYKVEQENLIVLHDDIDQPFGGLKLQKNRGHGGHNGIRSISEQLGNQDYLRVKIGVGRPPHPDMEVADYVLGRFSEEEQKQLPEFLSRVGDSVESLLFDGLSKAATLYNTTPKTN
jgi:PTH1 family peptidyl-tRNA hydrolase